jgi:hypothetical protein
MSTVPEINRQQIEQFLAAARQTIGEVQHCWLATRSLDGGANARAVRAHAGAPGADEWTRRILVRRGSRKVGKSVLRRLLPSPISMIPATGTLR